MLVFATRKFRFFTRFPPSMVNYYDILQVSPKATAAEVKSAYRRLARRLHPDSSGGSEATALSFAAIAEAYAVLGNPRERSRYDRKLLDIKISDLGNGDSVFASTNRHAQRWRQMVHERRYEDILDRMRAEKRRDAMAFQKVIYPTVALFLSSIVVTALKPRIFTESLVIGKIIIVALFIVSLIHIIGRIRDAIERYTDFDDNIHESILDEGERHEKPYSRLTAAIIWGGGFLACLGIGLLLGTQIEFAANSMPSVFSTYLKPEFIFYPPILTLIVDLMHSFAASLDR